MMLSLKSQTLYCTQDPGIKIVFVKIEESRNGKHFYGTTTIRDDKLNDCKQIVTTWRWMLDDAEFIKHNKIIKECNCSEWEEIRKIRQLNTYSNQKACICS